LENNPEINDIVDSLLSDVESVLSKLENSFSDPLVEVRNEIEKQEEALESISNKIPYPSVRYSTPDSNIISNIENIKVKISEQKISNVISKENTQEEAKITRELPIEIPVVDNEIPLPNIEHRIADRVVKTHRERSFVQNESKVLEKMDKHDEIRQITTNEVELEIEFIDIPKSTRLIHFYGPPSSGKTTFAIQSAIEIYPRNTYYFITSHSTSVIKRIKQMISHERWLEYKDIKKILFPIATQNLDELQSEIEKVKKLEPERVGLIIIDHLTDYMRGEIYKEEQRIILREILEQLYLLADEKNCKVLILNGYSYNNVAPAGDIVESYCDMTLTAELDQKKVNFITEEEEVKVHFDDSGIANLHVNIYFS
jgi:RecA/RadA recombinase